MKVKIRLFKPSDAEDLYKINTEEMGYDFSIEETREKLLALVDSTKDKIYVAIVNNKVVGYIHANDYDVIYAPHMKNIMGIAVLQQYKRHGIGKALLDAVEAWARQTGAYCTIVCFLCPLHSKFTFMISRKKMTKRKFNLFLGTYLRSSGNFLNKLL